MLHELGGLTFSNRYEACAPGPGDHVLHFREGRCLGRREGGRIVLPRRSDYPEAPAHVRYLFAIGEERYFLAEGDDVAAPAGWAYEPVRWYRELGPADARYAAAVGAQLDGWYRANRVCGRCGHALEHAPASRELVCPACANVIYPRINPGVIVGVTSGSGPDARIVLTRYAGRTTALWALVAGYCEVGETLEETVAREVMEEVGLAVRRVSYYKSQPWPYSGTLLAGFWAEVEGDPALVVDHAELKEARWFRRDEVPLERVGDEASMTGEMIERFRLGLE